MNPEAETAPKTSAATWLGLVAALFGILLARWIAPHFFPPLSVAIAAGGETLARHFMIGEALIWFCVLALLLIIRFGEGRTLRSVHLCTTPIGKSILWGIIIALSCAVAGAVVGFLSYFRGGELAKALFLCPLWLVVLVVITAGVAEELFYRGYAIERLEQFGFNRYLAGGIPLPVFGCAHITNGLANVVRCACPRPDSDRLLSLAARSAREHDRAFPGRFRFPRPALARPAQMMRATLRRGSLCLALATSAFAQEPSNRLIHEKSPYLLQHAHNPVDWYPWGAEAFEKARKENKPVFLSIGYSTCHWCHVMEHESFENPAIAKILNDHFVAIKVDREERLDVDSVYMTFVQATTGGGGWPMSVWLTPDLKPFVGGTYLPPEQFTAALNKIADAWKNDRARIVASSDEILSALQKATQTSNDTSAKLSAEVELKAYAQFASIFDPEFGGFGPTPKFPRPVIFNFLLRIYARDVAPVSSLRSAKDASRKLAPPEQHALEMTLVTLRKMAAGGIHDQLGGGFHRYSTDKSWHVPHFEKMLYDQAQLVVAYLNAFQITREPIFEQTARDILDYVRRDMTGPGGGFYSAEDADSLLVEGKPEHAEGAFYVWTKSEIDDALGPEPAKVFDYFYGVEAKGNAPEDPQGEFKNKNILSQRHSLSETAKEFRLSEEKTRQVLAKSRQHLLELRAKRPRPRVDDKIVTAWNGLMISAFARASQVLGDPVYLVAANKAADFARQNLYDAESHTLRRSYRDGASEVYGFASDYAFLIQGLLDLYAADFDASRIEWAIKLQEQQNALFWDEKNGGFFSTSGQDKNVLLRMKEDNDGAEPSPSSVAALNLLRLAAMLDKTAWREQAEKTLHAFDAQLNQAPAALPQMLVALDWSRAQPKQIVIAGKPDAADTAAMLREVRRHFLPNKALILADGGAGQKFFAARVEFMKEIAPIDDKATAYVCENFVCQLPTTDLEKLRQLLVQKRAPVEPPPPK